MGQVPSVSSVPPNGATGVALDAPLVFTFDVEMEDMVAIPTIPGIFVGNFEVTPASVPGYDCTWSDDLKILTCETDRDLPPNTTITWKLNPAGALLAFASAGGIPLATTTGSFTTGTGGGGGGGGGGEGAPKLVSTVPSNGSIGVSLTSTVQFVFDQEMKRTPGIGGTPPTVLGAIQWIGTGIDAAKFTYAWSADGKTLTAEYAGDFPPFAQVGWALNPEAGTVKLESAAGVALESGEYSGGFVTASSGGGGGGGNECDIDGIPDSWGFYTISKILNYVQTSASEPTASQEDLFQFGALVRGPEAGPAVTVGSVAIPPNRTQALEGTPIGGFYFYNDTKDTPALLNAAYPGGGYTLRFTLSGQAERVVPMTMPAGTPPVPRIENFAEAQAVNATQAFTLRWNAFTGATSQDSLMISIMDRANVVFQAPDPCVPRELAPTATSVVIPANTLAANKTYQATLSFGDIFFMSTNSIPNMAGFGSVSATTEFAIKTGTGGGTPATPARFTGYRVLPNGRPHLTLNGAPLSAYTLQRATRIQPGNWEPIGIVTTDPAGNGTYEDTQAGASFPLFYRAVAN